VKRFYTNQLGGGINTMSAPDAIPFFSGKETVQAQWAEMENWIPNTYGSLTKVTGFESYFTTGVSSPITGVTRYTKSSGESWLFYTQLGTLNRINSDLTATQIVTGRALTATPKFLVAEDKLIHFDGFNAPLTWDGGTTGLISDAIGTNPNVCIGAKGGIYSQRRLFMWGQPTDQNSVFYSNENDISTGYATQIIGCNISDGQKITGLAELFIPGTFETVLVVSKTNSIGIIKGDGSTTNPYTYSVINPTQGCYGPNAMVQFGQNLAYLTGDGVNTLQTDLQNVNLAQGDLTKLVKNRFALNEKSSLEKAIVQVDPLKTRLSFIVPEAGNATPNVIWHYHTGLGCWYKERWAAGQDGTASFIDTDNTWYHGQSDGTIYVHRMTGWSWAGSPINAIARTPAINFKDTRQKKQFGQCSIKMAGYGNSSLSIMYRYDYGARTNAGIVIPVNTEQFTWNGGEWNSDGSYLWQANQMITKRFYPNGLFENAQQVFTENSTYGPIQLFELGYDINYTGGY
jgi:hypothetical protein